MLLPTADLVNFYKRFAVGDQTQGVREPCGEEVPKRRVDVLPQVTQITGGGGPIRVAR
jgi:hypothetical protein